MIDGDPPGLYPEVEQFAVVIAYHNLSHRLFPYLLFDFNLRTSFQLSVGVD